MTNVELTTIKTLAYDLTDHLDGQWTITADTHYRRVTANLHRATDGMDILMTIKDDRPDRVEAHGLYPAGYPSRFGFDPNEMTAAISRGPEAIAKDLTRKVITPFGPALVAARERMAEYEANVAAAAVLRGDIAAAIGSGDYLHYTGKSGPGEYDTATAEFTVRSPYVLADVTLRGLNAEQTRALCAWLRQNVPTTAEG